MKERRKKRALERACESTLREAVIIGSILPCTAVIIFLSLFLAKNICMYRIFLLCIMPPSWPLLWAYYCTVYMTAARELDLWTHAADVILCADPELHIKALWEDGYSLTVHSEERYVEYINDDGEIAQLPYINLPIVTEKPGPAKRTTHSK